MGCSKPLSAAASSIGRGSATKSGRVNGAAALAVVKVSNIPVHPNVGMGVCGLPMYETPPIDCTTRAAKALVEIGKADGL